MIRKRHKQTRFQAVGTTKVLREWNMALLLQVLRTSSPMSRADLARRTGLTTPTVSAAIRRLLDLGCVTEVGEGSSSGGRRPILLALNRTSWYALGVDLGASRIRAVLLDLAGQVVAQEAHRRGASQVAEVLGDAAAMVGRLVASSGVARERILGLGVAIHGLVDQERGVSRFAPHFGWRNVPVAHLLEEQTGFPVVIDNDARMVALAEMTCGVAREAGDLLFVNVGEGVGAGIVIGGKLYRGYDDGAGEIGHMVVDPDGPPCSCGKYGCLEAIASGPGIARRAAHRVRLGLRSALADLVDGDLTRLTAEVVAQAAALGDRVARSALEEAGAALGIGLANAVNLINPSKIVLTGGVLRAKDFLLPSLFETLSRQALDVLTQRVEVGQVGELDAAIGGASMVLDAFFENPAGVGLEAGGSGSARAKLPPPWARATQA